jgi:hypothetical protein
VRRLIFNIILIFTRAHALEREFEGEPAGEREHAGERVASLKANDKINKCAHLKNRPVLRLLG